MLPRLTDLVLAHKRIVVAFWLAVAVAGGVFAPTTVDRLSYDFDLPGQPAFETNEQILATFGGGGLNDPLLFVVRGQDAAGTAARLARQAEQAVPGTRTVTAADPGAGVLTGDGGRLSTVVVYPPVTPGPEAYAEAQPRLEQVVAQAVAKAGRQAGGQGADVELTGFLLLLENGGSGDRGVLVEVVLGGLGALIVLALVFGSLLAAIPLLVAAVSILGTFLALLALTGVTDVVFVVQYLVALIGLGVAIDYSLLVVTRWREERDRGRAAGGGDGAVDNDEAVRRAMATAGHSVLFSGVTVAVSLAALVVVPLPFLRSIGLGGLLIPLLSVLTSLTLVPVVLSSLGPRLTWPRRKPVSARSRLWTGVARAVLRRRWLTVVGAIVVLLALAAPVLGLSLGSPQLSGLTSADPAARAAQQAVEAGVPRGVVRPVEVLLDDDAARGAVSALREADGVAAVAAPRAGSWRGDGLSLVQVYLADDPASSEGKQALSDLRDADIPGVEGIGGSPAEDADFVSAVYGGAPYIVLAVVVVTFLLLARALRSLWLPIKALALNVVSIAAAYGVTVLVWQEGFGSGLLFGQEATGAITIWVPIAAFAFLFGLSMDYEVFILARMRESHDEHGETDRAVVEGIGYTGRLVTSAALILFLAFIALSTVPSVEVKVLATALALGIAIDAVIVRGLLAPALVAVLGGANWTMPRWLAAVVRIRVDADANSGPETKHHPNPPTDLAKN